MDLMKKRKLDDNGVLQSDSFDAITKITIDDARKIIEPFTQEQLLDIVQNAVLRHADVLDAVRLIADRDLTQRKLFIRGLGWDTSNEGLRSLFSTYGDLEEAVVILDKVTGKSKGYGFVTFKHVDGALLALKEPSKKIDGRMTVTQLAAPGASGPVANAAPPPPVDVSTRKIYVANVPFDMPGDRLLAHFSSYGEVEEGPLGFDKQTGRSKGFALFVYKTAEAAQAALVDPTKTIDGRQMFCKLAIDGKKNKPGGPTQSGSAAAQTPTGADGAGSNGHGIGIQQSSMPNSMALQYGGQAGPGGISAYGGFSGGGQGPPPLGHHHHSASSIGGPGMSSVGGSGPGLSSVGGQAPSSFGGSGGYGAGLGGAYGSSYYGIPGSTGFGGLSGAGGGGGGLGGVNGGSSLYGRLPPSSAGMHSGGNESAHYSLSSSAFPSQQHQPSGTSPIPRLPPGGMFPGIPPYY